MKTFFTTVLVIGLIGMAGFIFATAKTVPGAAVGKKATSGEMETQASAGMIVNTKNGLTLMAKDTAYLLESKELEGMVGKKVTVNGKLIKGDPADTILVAKIEEIK